MTITRFHFRDRGQDFLWWDVEPAAGSIGKVVDCGPFLASVWADGRLHVNLSLDYRIGDHLIITNDLAHTLETGNCAELNYPIERIEIVGQA